MDYLRGTYGYGWTILYDDDADDAGDHPSISPYTIRSPVSPGLPDSASIVRRRPRISLQHSSRSGTVHGRRPGTPRAVTRLPLGLAACRLVEPAVGKRGLADGPRGLDRTEKRSARHETKRRLRGTRQRRDRDESTGLSCIGLYRYRTQASTSDSSQDTIQALDWPAPFPTSDGLRPHYRPS
jgi:hypothetical protein